MSESFNFDFSSLMSNAASIFNSFSPLFLGIAGISVGLGLITVVIREIRKAL